MGVMLVVANSGGGGGAGGAGGDGVSGTNPSNSGNGGTGLNYSSTFGTFYGDSGWFAGGGGGSIAFDSYSGVTSSTSSRGGKGGGGYAGIKRGQNGQNGKKHTGGGGGGGANTPQGNGGAGGSGIVLLQTNVATPSVNSEAVVSKDSYVHAMVEDNQTHLTYRKGYRVSPGQNKHSSGGYHDNIRKPDGSLGRVYRATANGYIYIEGAGSLVSTVEGIFYPIEQQRYDNILEIGHNSSHDVELEMAADGTAKLYRNNGGNELASGTVKCFTVGKWHHVVLTLDANRNAVAYVNGYPVVSATYSSAILPGSRTGKLYI